MSDETLREAVEALAREYWQEWGNLHALRFAVESHAVTYADHPDYREEWRP